MAFQANKIEFGLSLVLAVQLLAGCTSTLTSEGQMVRIIDANKAQECKLITFMYEDLSRERGIIHQDNMILDVRNKAAERGADSVAIVDPGFDVTVRGLVRVNAYNCSGSTSEVSPKPPPTELPRRASNLNLML